MDMKRYILGRARVLAVLCLIGLLLPFVSYAIPDRWETLAWLFDLASHWQWLYLGGLLLFGTITAIADRRWAWMLLAAPMPWLTASPAAPMSVAASGQALAVLSANLHLDNTDARPLQAMLEREGPDIVVLLELSPDYARQIEGLHDYPHQHLQPEYSPFGIGLISRHPLRQVRTMGDDDGVARIEADVEIGASSVHLIALHPMPPIEARFHTRRNMMLREIAESEKVSGKPTVIVGDFNATPWSSAFASLRGQGFRRASSLEGTWPAPLGALGLPLDQLLVSEAWSVDAFKVLDGLGSDHRAILSRLNMNPQSASITKCNTLTVESSQPPRPGPARSFGATVPAKSG
jgi:endonuclease/exonuclease/phosphatase (EEP) superfamily protein YafD